MFLGVTLSIVSGLLIAAHFLREGSLLLVLIGLAFPFLLFFRKPWSNRVVQALLILAAAEWLRSLVDLAAQRHLAGESWTRMAFILGAVALVNVVAAVAVNPKKSAR